MRKVDPVANVRKVRRVVRDPNRSTFRKRDERQPFNLKESTLGLEATESSANNDYDVSVFYIRMPLHRRGGEGCARARGARRGTHKGAIQARRFNRRDGGSGRGLWRRPRDTAATGPTCTADQGSVPLAHARAGGI